MGGKVRARTMHRRAYPAAARRARVVKSVKQQRRKVVQRKVMISCAVTGSADTPGKNPAVPEDDAAEHGRRAVRRSLLGCGVATPADARDMLGLRKPAETAQQVA